MSEPIQFLTSEQAQKRLGITKDQLRSAVKKGQVSSYQFGEALRFLESDIEGTVTARMVAEAKAERERHDRFQKWYADSDLKKSQEQMTRDESARLYARPVHPPGSLPLP